MTLEDLRKWLNARGLSDWVIASDDNSMLVNGSGRVKIACGTLYVWLTITKGMVPYLDGSS